MEHQEQVTAILSRLTEENVKAVDSTVVFAFADETVVQHDVYWCENGEIIPKDRSLEYEDLMDTIYSLPKNTWNSGIVHYGVFVNADNEVFDQPFSHSDSFGVYTNKEIISEYIDSLNMDEVIITKPNYKKLH